MMYKKYASLLIILVINTFIFGQKIEENYLSRNNFQSSVKNSVLAEGTWYKFAIDTSGVFKIDRQFLQNLGINTSEINPKNIRIYGNGGQLLPMLNGDFRYDGLQENAIYINGEEDNSFDANDYILFYGKGPHHWNVDPNQADLSRHITNIYEDNAYYFITTDNGAGKRITNETGNSLPAGQQITTFNDYVYFEEEKTNLFANGQQWFGKDLSFENTTRVNFNFKNLDTSKDIYIRVRGVIVSSTPSQMEVKVNGQNLTTINFPALPSSPNSLTLAIPREAIKNINVNTDQIQVEVTYNNNGNPSAKAYLDYVELIGEKNLVAENKQFSFRSFIAATELESTILEYNIQNSANISQLWNVTDHINPKIITNQSTGSNFTFKINGGSIKEYIVLNDNDYFTPLTLSNSKVDNQNLHSLRDIDYVIITQDYLISEAERLAIHHRTNSGLNVRVIDLDEIYNEFASGTRDLTAIRDFVRHLYQNASSNETRIKYVCLFGDSSYDFKDRINNNNNIVPAFQSYESFDLARSYVTDDYYGMMDDNEGDLDTDDDQDVATGRFLVTTIAEAKATVDKTLNYYATSSFGDWRNKITVIA
ncbi:MAG: type IX secretion system sortase PorU, partial [Bacteroidia bacterium]|nr:type IX secretion system sortase PorU [Bacteroidia bacterium]